jgi:hypothetical protein
LSQNSRACCRAAGIVRDQQQAAVAALAHPPKSTKHPRTSWRFGSLLGLQFESAVIVPELRQKHLREAKRDRCVISGGPYGIDNGAHRCPSLVGRLQRGDSAAARWVAGSGQCRMRKVTWLASIC